MFLGRVPHWQRQQAGHSERTGASGAGRFLVTLYITIYAVRILADDRAIDFSRRSGHLSGGADALAAVAETVAVPGGRRLGHPSRWVAGRPGQE